MAQVAAYARSYTPEWRYEGAEDDPGSALAELFGDLFYQTVDRMNSVPGKLHTEFLNLTGFQMPDPVPAAGLLQFTAHDTVEEPVPVPEGTQVFTPDEEGENVVYETVRSIQSTPARLTGLFYVDARAEVIQRLDLDRPQPFFTPAQGENLQHHRFTVSQSDVLSLSGPFQVEAELRLEGGLPGAETAQRLSDPALARWTFHSGGAEVPFSRVRAKGDTVVLDYDGTEALEADGEGNFSISCWGQLGAGALVLDGVGLRSRPAGRVSVDSASNGDIPLDLEAGGYCFGRRPRRLRPVLLPLRPGVPEAGEPGEPAPGDCPRGHRPDGGGAPVPVQSVHHRQAGRGGHRPRRRIRGPGGLGVLQRPGLAAPHRVRKPEPLLLQE